MSNIFFLFQNTTFGPEELTMMGEAYDLVTRAMPEQDQYDVARGIIVVAQRRTFTSASLSAQVMELLADGDETGKQATA